MAYSLPSCPYCGKPPSYIYREPSPGFPEGTHEYECTPCAKRADDDYPYGPMAYAWVSTWPWHDEETARAEWLDAAECEARDLQMTPLYGPGSEPIRHAERVRPG